MIYEYWLAGIEGISNLKKRKLREVYGNGKAIYYIEETNLKKHTFLNEKDIERLKKAKKTVNLEMQWEKSVKKKIKFVPYFRMIIRKNESDHRSPVRLVRTWIAAG